MAYSIRKPLKKTTKRIIAVILSVIGVILAVVAVKYAVWLYEDIRFKNDPNYIPQWMETKLWNLIDFPDSELLPVEKIQALFPLPEDESERTAIADELIQLFMERVNPGYEFEKYFDTSGRYWAMINKKPNYAGWHGMFTLVQKDEYPSDGYIEFVWITNGVLISYCYHTDGNVIKEHATIRNGIPETGIYSTITGSYFADYYIPYEETRKPVMLVLDKNSGNIKLSVGLLSKGIIRIEDFADYRLAQANGEAPKRTSIKEIQKYIEKTKGE